MKKIAIVVNSAWHGYNFRLNLARNLKNENYKVVFITPKDGVYSNKLKQEFCFIAADFNMSNINPINDLKYCISLYQIYKENSFDIVLNFTIKPNIYSSIVAKLLKIDSINNITGLGTVFIRKTIITTIVKMLYRLSLSCATHVFFQNSDDLNYFIDAKLVLDNKTSTIPGSGVDVERFKPVDINKNTIFRFLVVARIIQDKGIYEYIDAARKLKKKYNNVEFGILGELEPSNRTAISKDKILKLHNDVIRYLGKTDNVYEYLANADCVVLPSYREGSPRALMEASSMEIPVIGTNVTGCSQVVDDGVTGLLCAVRNAEDLALKMEKILNMSLDSRKKMGRLGRKKMKEEFDESLVIKRYINTIKGIFVGREV